MHLFMFREVADRGARAFRSTHIRPSIYAVHPTRETITEEEWEGIVREAGSRYRKDRDRHSKAVKQVLQEIKENGLRLFESGGMQYCSQRLGELGVTPFGMVKSLAEVLAENGFKIVTPQELVFRTPLNQVEEGIVAERARAGDSPLEELVVSNALSTLCLCCGVDESELEFLISGE